MTVPELIEKVNDKTLSKEQLEKYQTDVSYIFQRMMVEIADIEKEKALFFINSKNDYDVETEIAYAMAETNYGKIKRRELSDVAIKRNWSATDKGQREIELKRWSLALKEMLNSLKSRI